MALAVDMAVRLNTAASAYSHAWETMATASRAIADEAPALGQAIKRGIGASTPLPAAVTRVYDLEPAFAQVAAAHSELLRVIDDTAAALKASTGSTHDAHLGAALVDLRAGLERLDERVTIRPGRGATWTENERFFRGFGVIASSILGVETVVVGGPVMAGIMAASTIGVASGAALTIRRDLTRQVAVHEFVRVLSEATDNAAHGVASGKRIAGGAFGRNQVVEATKSLATLAEGAAVTAREQTMGLADRVRTVGDAAHRADVQVAIRADEIGRIRADAAAAINADQRVHVATIQSAFADIEVAEGAFLSNPIIPTAADHRVAHAELAVA